MFGRKARPAAFSEAAADKDAADAGELRAGDVAAPVESASRYSSSRAAFDASSENALLAFFAKSSIPLRTSFAVDIEYIRKSDISTLKADIFEIFFPLCGCYPVISRLKPQKNFFRETKKAPRRAGAL